MDYPDTIAALGAISAHIVDEPPAREIPDKGGQATGREFTTCGACRGTGLVTMERAIEQRAETPALADIKARAEAAIARRDGQ